MVGPELLSVEIGAGGGIHRLQPITILWRQSMKVKAYIHSLKDHEHDRHVMGEAEIIECIGDNLYLAEVNGIRCTAIFNFFTGAYYVDDVYGVVKEAAHA